MRTVLVACWTVKGGAGATVVAAGMAAAQAQLLRHDVLLVDLAGDQPLLHGLPPSSSAGLRGWTRAGPAVPVDALGRLEEPVDERRRLLPAGEGAWCDDRAHALAATLAGDERIVVADVGQEVGRPVGASLVAAAERSILVVRACPLSMRALAELPAVPDAVVVVRDRRRALGWRGVANRCGAPVVAEIEVDPAIGASVDAGETKRPFPRRFLLALGGAA
ncbi:MAG: hypothetical protein KDB04_14665 [Acidimicrobiales bacterium]|nr:hypothetical protein [Acidimicrobiales bacterium]HRW39862.1 hypothetical protein [Aquihabitans sp.]